MCQFVYYLIQINLHISGWVTVQYYVQGNNILSLSSSPLPCGEWPVQYSQISHPQLLIKLGKFMPTIYALYIIECIITIYAYTNMASRRQRMLVNKRFEVAFDFIKHVFKVKKLYDEQMRLIKAFCNGSNVFFNAILIYNI